MARTLTQLFASYTPDECKARLLARCTAKGFPITDWNDGGVARTLIEIEAQENSDFSANSAELAKAIFFETAVGDDWVTLDAKDWFSTNRGPATYAVRVAVCTNNGTGPITVVAGQLYFASGSGLRYTNLYGYTLAVGATVAILARAELAGSAYNVPITALLTPIPGLTLDSDAFAAPGADAESNTSLKTRCYAKWATLGSGMAADAYKSWALGYGSAVVVTRVKVSTAPDGSGVVTVLLAGPAGVVGGADVTGVQTLLRSKAGNSTTVNCASATGLAAGITAAVTVRATETTSAAYIIAANALIAAYIATLEIGGTFYLAQLVELLMTPVGAVNVTVSLPAADLTASATQILAFATPTLVVTEV